MLFIGSSFYITCHLDIYLHSMYPHDFWYKTQVCWLVDMINQFFSNCKMFSNAHIICCPTANSMGCDRIVQNTLKKKQLNTNCISARKIHRLSRVFVWIDKCMEPSHFIRWQMPMFQCALFNLSQDRCSLGYHNAQWLHLAFLKLPLIYSKKPT